ncbi:DUF2924 domain-containing protein [bacterium]|nr:DUF2924 domain-containing protein [bacterium]MBU1912864.1 DUF2924 domain-containing protein [Candidatus Omnitrophota bacterium]
MRDNAMVQIMALKEAPLDALQKKYSELYGKDALSNNRTYLWRRIAYRLQELEYGGLSKKAQKRLKELIELYDPINNRTLRSKSIKKRPDFRDERLPIPGTVIVKNYKGQKLEVKVLEKGFEYSNKIYKTLTALAQEITGSHWSGYEFFNI